jgi:hypothetical protein
LNASKDEALIVGAEQSGRGVIDEFDDQLTDCHSGAIPFAREMYLHLHLHPDLRLSICP